MKVTKNGLHLMSYAHKCVGGCCSAPDSTGGAYDASPDPLIILVSINQVYLYRAISVTFSSAAPRIWGTNKFRGHFENPREKKKRKDEVEESSTEIDQSK